MSQVLIYLNNEWKVAHEYQREAYIEYQQHNQYIEIGRAHV